MPSTAKPVPVAAVTHRPRVLLVDDEPALVDVLSAALATAVGVDCHVTVARTLAQAKRHLAAGTFELLLADVNLPDGSGLALLPHLRRHCPAASAIVITGDPTVDRAVAAMRDGAVDFLPKPFDAGQITDRLRKALDRQAAGVRATARLRRLRGAVRKLSASRRLVSQKVDLLCQDLIGAYTDLATQMDAVRTTESFRKAVALADGDLEQLLCHTMDWLLREMGPANVGLWLAGEDGAFQLGAYMKHTVAGGDDVVEAMRAAVLPAAARDGLLHCPGEELADLTPSQRAILAEQDVLALSATYLGEPLATLVFFRDAAASAFDDDDVAVLRAVGPVFATALAAVVRDEAGDGEGPFADGPVADRDDEEDATGRPEDWWKRGEKPPF